MSVPRIAIGPRATPFVADAIEAGGGSVVALQDEPDGLVWLDPRGVSGLADALTTAAGARWIQLPMAGVEAVAESGLFDSHRLWTCAKGAYAEPVAEHALALSLAGLRHLPTRLAARSWGSPSGISLYEQKVTILGGGGITQALVELLAPFRTETTVVRRSAEPVPGAARTLSQEALPEALAGAQLVVLALALTPATRGIIGAPELSLMRRDAWLVNVARGRHVDSDALTTALDEGAIAGAALDVTDPEPLPDGHPLWEMPNCIITPHTADTTEMVQPLLAARIRDNVTRFRTGQPLLGVVDTGHGY